MRTTTVKPAWDDATGPESKTLRVSTDLRDEVRLLAVLQRQNLRDCVESVLREFVETADTAHNGIITEAQKKRWVGSVRAIAKQIGDVARVLCIVYDGKCIVVT